MYNHAIRQTTTTRVILAGLAGAILGGAIHGLDYAWGFYHDTHPAHGDNYFLEYGVRSSLSVATVSSFLWLVGIVCFGGPIWSVLHKANKTKLWHAMLTGFVLLFIIILAVSTGGFDGESNSTISLKQGDIWIWQDRQLTHEGWKRAVMSASAMGLVGAAVGAVICKIAYRKRPSTIGT